MWVIKTYLSTESTNQRIGSSFIAAREGCSINIRAMGSLVIAVVTYIRALFVTRHRLALEAAALRQQLAVFKPLRAKIDETAFLVVITEQGENRNQT